MAHIARSWKTTAYLTELTHREILKGLTEGTVKKMGRVEFIRPGQRFAIGDIEISPFAIPHDAVDPIGFSFRSNGSKVAIVTDLG